MVLLVIVLDLRWMFWFLLVLFIYNEVFFKVEDKECVILKLGFLGRKWFYLFDFRMIVSSKWD